MAEQGDDLAGNLDQVGGSPEQQAPPPAPEQSSGLPGVLDQVVNGQPNAQGPTTMRGLLGLNQGGENPTAPGADVPKGTKVEVDFQELQNAINAYNEEIGQLAEASLQCDAVLGVKAPGEEFASHGYAKDHKTPAESLQQAFKSHIDALIQRRNALQKAVAGYQSTDQGNADNLRLKDRGDKA